MIRKSLLSKPDRLFTYHRGIAAVAWVGSTQTPFIDAIAEMLDRDTHSRLRRTISGIKA